MAWVILPIIAVPKPAQHLLPLRYITNALIANLEIPEMDSRDFVIRFWADRVKYNLEALNNTKASQTEERMKGLKMEFMISCVFPTGFWLFLFLYHWS